MPVPVEQTPATPAWDRLSAALVLALGGFITVLLLQATPDPRGFGTHEQLGMVPCGWPPSGGLPCPTCGATTAACHLVHLSPIDALSTHPFGAAVAGVGLWLSIWAGFCLLSGRSFLDPMVRLRWGSIGLWTLAVFLGSWAFKYLTFPS